MKLIRLSDKRNLFVCYINEDTLELSIDVPSPWPNLADLSITLRELPDFDFELWVFNMFDVRGLKFTREQHAELLDLLHDTPPIRKVLNTLKSA